MNPNGYSTDKSLDALKTQHAWRSPNDEAKEILRRLRQEFLNISVFLDVKLPPSRERSLALTKLDEARMWASNAATLMGEVKEDLIVNIPA